MNRKVVFYVLAGFFAVILVINLFSLDWNDLFSEENKSSIIQLIGNLLLCIAMLVAAITIKTTKS